MRLVSIILCALCLWGDLVFAHADEQSTQSIDVEALFERYVENYNAFLNDGDEAAIDAAAGFYADEIMLLNAAAVSVSRAQLRESLLAVLQDYRSAGVKQMVWRDINPCRINKGTILSSNVITRFHASGSVYDELGATFILSASSDGWKIKALALQGNSVAVSFAECNPASTE